MAKSKIQQWIENDTAQLCEAIAEKEGLLNDREYDSLKMYVSELEKVVNWCTTIREAERLKKMLKE